MTVFGKQVVLFAVLALSFACDKSKPSAQGAPGLDPAGTPGVVEGRSPLALNLRKPSRAAAAMRQISYICDVPAESYRMGFDSRRVIESSSETADCRVGYDQPSTGALNSLPFFKGRKIEAPLDLKHAFQSDIDPGLMWDAASSGFDLQSNIKVSNIPVGSFDDCTHLEYQVQQKVYLPSGRFELQEARLGFERKRDPIKNELYWSPLASNPTPSLFAVIAAAPSSVRLYFHCGWRDPVNVVAETL